MSLPQDLSLISVHVGIDQGRWRGIVQHLCSGQNQSDLHVLSDHELTNVTKDSDWSIACYLEQVGAERETVIRYFYCSNHVFIHLDLAKQPCLKIITPLDCNDN